MKMHSEGEVNAGRGPGLAGSHKLTGLVHLGVSSPNLCACLSFGRKFSSIQVLPEVYGLPWTICLP